MMYSKEDLTDIFDKLRLHLESSTEKEISYYLNMNAIFVELLLHDAEKQTTTVQVEVSQVENMDNMKHMNEFICSLSDIQLNKNVKTMSQIGSISNIEKLITDNENLKHKYDLLNEKVSILNNKIEMLENENKNLGEQNRESSEINSSLRSQIQELSKAISDKHNKDNNKDNLELLKKLEDDCNVTKNKLNQQIEQYQKLLKDFDKKVSESAQFKTLKKLLQDKNTLIVQLKTQIAKFEDKNK